MGIFDSLTESIKALTKSIEDNHNGLANRLKQQSLENQVAEGKLTQEQAFEKMLDFTKGKMISCFCTHCGNRIDLHEKIDDGFCQFCGELVSIHGALRGDFDSAAIENISGEDLFSVANSKDKVNMELVKHAAKKNNVDACRMVAYQGFTDGDFNTAYEYSVVVAGIGDADCQVYWLLSAACIEKMDINNALERIKKIQPNKLQTEEAKKVRELGITIITDKIREIERERERARRAEELRIASYAASQSWTPTPEPPRDRSLDHGPLATAFNCGMPVTDCSDL